MSNTPDEILDWNTQMLIREAVLQNVSESKKINITQEMVDESKAEAKQALYQLILTEVIGGDRHYRKYEECPLCRNYQYSCSCDEVEEKVKAIQRQTLAKLFGITEGEK